MGYGAAIVLVLWTIAVFTIANFYEKSENREANILVVLGIWIGGSLIVIVSSG